MPLLVPLFVVSFRRADELALAMEARCYRPGDRAHPAAPIAGGWPTRLLLVATAVVIAIGLLV